MPPPSHRLGKKQAYCDEIFQWLWNAAVRRQREERMLSRRTGLLGALAGLMLMDRATAASRRVEAATDPADPDDLADLAAGTYSGNVISDARGSGRSNVRLFVVKTGPNTVRVTSSYSRLPPFSAELTRAMDTIQKADGPGVFLLNLSKHPFGLDVTIDDASWSGVRRGQSGTDDRRTLPSSTTAAARGG
jgi:hypothetical protein